MLLNISIFLDIISRHGRQIRQHNAGDTERAMLLKLQKQKWDEWAIRAELRRKGFRFKDMAKESGFSASSLRAALTKPSTKVNLYIANKLGAPAHELWPDWFDADGELIPAKYRRKLSALRTDSASRESRAA